MESSLRSASVFAWKKFLPRVQGEGSEATEIASLTGSNKLITLKLSKQALICVTVLLYTCNFIKATHKEK